MDAKAAVLAALILLAGGCVHEQVAWPPTSQDVRRINAAADATSGWLRVQYVEPLATDQGAHVNEPSGIESFDVERIAFQTRDGSVHPIPITMVKGVTVKERGTGALIGGGIGLAGGALLLGTIYLVATAYPHDINQSSNWSCDSHCWTHNVPVIVLGPAVVGAVLGYVIGGRRTFDLGGAR